MEEFKTKFSRNYSNMNKYVERPTKTHIKTVFAGNSEKSLQNSLIMVTCKRLRLNSAITNSQLLNM